jgi:hypothetical protein
MLKIINVDFEDAIIDARTAVRCEAAYRIEDVYGTGTAINLSLGKTDNGRLVLAILDEDMNGLVTVAGLDHAQVADLAGAVMDEVEHLGDDG